MPEEPFFVAKVVLLSTVGIATFFASALPFYFSAYLGSSAMRWISSASAASAGIVTGAFLCHMLPESSESFSKYFEGSEMDPEGSLATYPFAGLLCGAVLSFLVMIDSTIVKGGIDGAGEEAGDVELSPHSHDHISDGLRRFAASAAAGKNEGDGASASRDASEMTGLLRVVPTTTSATSASSSSSAAADAFANGAASTLSTSVGVRKRILRVWVFFFALSLHGVFDGLSVGSETSSSGFTSIVLAVMSHKLFDGLALGCAIYPAKFSPWHRWLILAVCAATTPLGIGIGMAAEEAADSKQSALVTGISLGLASGTFCFVALMELLPSALADGRWTKRKLALFVTGFTAMAVLAAYV